MPDHSPPTYDATYRTINSVTSREMDNLVLVYGNSNNNVWNALAFQIVRTRRRIERVTSGPTLAADGNAGDTLSFGYFGANGHSTNATNPGDEVFQIDTERSSTIVEYGISVAPDGVLTGVRTVSDDAVSGSREGSDRLRGFGADNLQQYGGVESEHTRTDTPHEIPTTALAGSARQGLLRIDSDNDGLNRFSFAFDNTTASSVTVSVEAIGQTYDVVPVTDTARVKRMLRGNNVNRRLLTYGGFTTTNPNLPTDWYNYRARVGESDIRQALQT